MAPFQLPGGMPETDIATKLFANWKELYGIFIRCSQEKAPQLQMRLNRNKAVRRLDPGDIVYRRLPAPARLAKHLLPEQGLGPYEMVGQTSFFSCQLKDPVS